MKNNPINAAVSAACAAVFALGSVSAVHAMQPSPPNIVMSSTLPAGAPPHIAIKNGEQYGAWVVLQPGGYSTIPFSRVWTYVDAGGTAYLDVLDAKIGSGVKILHIEAAVYGPKGLVRTRVQLYEVLRVSPAGNRKVSFEEAFLSRRMAIGGNSEKAMIQMGGGYVDSSPVVPLAFFSKPAPKDVKPEDMKLASVGDLVKLPVGTLALSPQVAGGPGLKAFREGSAEMAVEEQSLRAGGGERLIGPSRVDGTWSLRDGESSYRAGWGFTVRLWQNFGSGWVFIGNAEVGSGGFWSVFPSSASSSSVPIYIEYLAHNRLVSFRDPSGNVYAWGHTVPPSASAINVGSWYGDLTGAGDLPGLSELWFGAARLWDKFAGWSVSPVASEPYRVTYPNSLASGSCRQEDGGVTRAWSCSASGGLFLIAEHANASVIQHELAHAINKFYWGRQAGPGGRHELERCYSAGLHMSEGFANFVAYWVQFNFDAWRPRAPYLDYDIEDIISEGLCQGNEAWVSAAFWDLYDYWNDGWSPDKFDSLYFTNYGYPISVYLRNPRDRMPDYLSLFQARQPADVQRRLADSFRMNDMLP